MLPEARLELYDAIAAAVPAGVDVNAYPIKSGHKSRFAASVTVAGIVRGVDDTHQMLEAELIIEAPASAGIDVAYGQIDLLQSIVDEALPINWLKVPGWDLSEETDPIPALYATAQVLGNPPDEAPPVTFEYMLIGGTDRAVISYVPNNLGRIR